MTLASNAIKIGIGWLLCSWCVLSLTAQQDPRILHELKKQKAIVELEFTVSGGYYNHPLELELYAPKARIYYTLDGTRPTRHSARYRRTLHIDKTTVVRAVAYKWNKKSPVVGHTYFINEPSTAFPTVSLSLPPSVLFDPDKGMFVIGNNAVDTIWSLPGANFWSRKEVRVNTEIFESDGSCVFRSETGLRLFGGMSRLFPQKSLVLVTRKRYGAKNIKHPIFGKKGLKKHKFLVLRNSGSDFGKTHFRDAFMTGLLNDWTLDKQNYRPSHVYINGTYWGIYNIREKINRYFVEGHHRVDKDSISLMEHKQSRKRGSKRHYLKMKQFIAERDLSIPENYAYVKTQMDVQNFMDYQIAQIYFDNQDAGGNIKYWREQKPNGKWQWILYDTDWGFGLHNTTAYKNNSLTFHTEAEGPNWPNPPWSTLILRNLLENETFKKEFIHRFADFMNVTFQPNRVEKHIDKYVTPLLSEIPRHHERWHLSRDKWKQHIKILHNFATQRPRYMWAHLQEEFGLDAPKGLEIQVSHGGRVEINDNISIKRHFVGQYFTEIPISVNAIPNFGYRFSHWEGLEVEDNWRELTLRLISKDTLRLKAVFEKFNHPLAEKIIINEVSANNRATGDWVELFNHSDEKVSLKNWVLTDRKNEFRFPNITIDANDYLVVCQDSSKLHKHFPQSYNIVDGLSFGISKWRETLSLFTDNGAAVDSMAYLIEPTDSVFTFNLLLPYLDNGNLDNWELKRGAGSPNAPNPYYVESTIRGEQEQFIQMGVIAAMMLICLGLLGLRNRHVEE